MSKIDQVDEFADGVEEELLFLGEHDERRGLSPPSLVSLTVLECSLL